MERRWCWVEIRIWTQVGLWGWTRFRWEIVGEGVEGWEERKGEQGDGDEGEGKVVRKRSGLRRERIWGVRVDGKGRLTIFNM
jgi:hypothetical protein